MESKSAIKRKLIWPFCENPYNSETMFRCPTGHRNALQLQTFYICYCEPEKHLWSQDAVDTLLDGAVSEGVLYFRTPLGRTLTRML